MNHSEAMNHPEMKELNRYMQKKAQAAQLMQSKLTKRVRRTSNYNQNLRSARNDP